MRFKIRENKTKTRCPYCHEDIFPGEEEIKSCSDCSAPHHQECWEENESLCCSCLDYDKGYEILDLPSPEITSFQEAYENFADNAKIFFYVFVTVLLAVLSIFSGLTFLFWRVLF